jgi:hypothetical protein
LRKIDRTLIDQFVAPYIERVDRVRVGNVVVVVDWSVKALLSGNGDGAAVADVQSPAIR